MSSNPERRYDSLTRSEFMDAFSRLDEKMDQLAGYQREANGKIATAYEKLATLEERTQSLKDGPGRVAAAISLFIAVIAFIMSMGSRVTAPPTH